MFGCSIIEHCEKTTKRVKKKKKTPIILSISQKHDNANAIHFSTLKTKRAHID